MTNTRLMMMALCAGIVGCGGVGAPTNVPLYPDLSINQACTPITVLQGGSIRYESGMVKSHQECGGGLQCFSDLGCTIRYNEQAQHGLSGYAFVDAVTGSVAISYDQTVSASNNGTVTRLKLPPRDLSSGLSFTVALGSGSQIGSIGFSN